MDIRLLNIVDSIIDKKQICWQFGIENGRLVTKYPVGGESISNMLFSGYYDFTGVLVPTFDFTEITFLEKLKIKHWSYTDFVLLAILFCIKDELSLKTSDFLILSKNIVYLLFDENTLEEEVFNVLKYTNLFNLYKRDALYGLNFFFQEMINTISLPRGYSWNTVGIFRILSLFNFDLSIIDKCIIDCTKQNTLGPLILALYVEETQLNLSSASVQESVAIINNFEKFKVSLKKNYLNKSFF